MLQERYYAGLNSCQLEMLCQPERIEETMRLLFALNHWAKARERLYYADRQGLYQVKVALLQEAYTRGLLTVKAYVDGKEEFGKELALELAADIAAEGFLWRLEELASLGAGCYEDANAQIVHRLYTRITGREAIQVSDVEQLESVQVHAYLLRALQELERVARASGQPIPYRKLGELCIAPSDLLTIQDRRYYDFGHWDSWEQLDASDLRKLDPEGLSLLAFDYTSPTAHYVFHLPLRMAESFVPAEKIAGLKSTPWSSRESGEYYGRAVTEHESLRQPITEILRALGADIATLCPRQLREKGEVLITRYTEWYDEEEDDEDDEHQALSWQNLARVSVTTWRSSDICPHCATPIPNSSELARVDHWQRTHPDQHLTVSQAMWLMGCSNAKRAFCQHYPPDYRLPHPNGWGTRYWTVSRLRGWLNDRAKGEGKQKYMAHP